MIAPVAAKTESRLFAELDPIEIEVSVKWENEEKILNGKWTFDPPGDIWVNTKSARITYTLSPDSAPGVRFAVQEGKEAPPVLWVSPISPKNLTAKVSLFDEKKLVIEDLNDTKPGQEKRFQLRLVAVYDDVIRISPDPTIINVDPTDGISPMAS